MNAHARSHERIHPVPLSCDQKRDHYYAERHYDSQCGREYSRGTVAPTALDGNLDVCIDNVVPVPRQLAGWVAMHKSSFEQRPVAASAGRVLVHSLPSANGPVDLEVEISSFRHGAVSYRGLATVAGEPVITLERAVGPLLPMEEFDDSVRMRDLFDQVRKHGLPARPLVSADDYRPAIELENHLEDQLRATLRVPQASAIYADHFPRRPLYPATLLLGSQIDETVARFARADGSLRKICEVRAVKVRSFCGPGEQLRLEIGREESKDDGLIWFGVATWKDDARVSSMRVALEG